MSTPNGRAGRLATRVIAAPPERKFATSGGDRAGIGRDALGGDAVVRRRSRSAPAERQRRALALAGRHPTPSSRAGRASRPAWSAGRAAPAGPADHVVRPGDGREADRQSGRVSSDTAIPPGSPPASAGQRNAATSSTTSLTRSATRVEHPELVAESRRKGFPAHARPTSADTSTSSACRPRRPRAAGRTRPAAAELAVPAAGVVQQPGQPGAQVVDQERRAVRRGPRSAVSASAPGVCGSTVCQAGGRRGRVRGDPVQPFWVVRVPARGGQVLDRPGRGRADPRRGRTCRTAPHPYEGPSHAAHVTVSAVDFLWRYADGTVPACRAPS